MLTNALMQGDMTMKTVGKILEYQKVIERVLSRKGSDVSTVENICLCRIGHIACYESFQHALQDLIANGRIKCCGDSLWLV